LERTGTSLLSTLDKRVSDGTRTRDSQIHNLEPISHNSNCSNTYGEPQSPLALPLAQESSKPPATDPDLARLLDAWPDLPPHIRAAVLALIGTAR
jgi:hypothetical protein